MRLLFALLFGLVPGVVGKKTNGTGTDSLTAKTSTGSFTGIVDKEFPNTRQWRSIPFAEAPVASRRWLPPQALSPSDEHHYSARFPQSCAQFVSADPDMYFWASD